MKNKKKIKILEKRIEVIEAWLINLSTFLSQEQEINDGDLEDKNGLEVSSNDNSEEE
jgi:hypothetical protein